MSEITLACDGAALICCAALSLLAATG